MAPDLNRFIFVTGLHQFGSYFCTCDSDTPGMHEATYILCCSSFDDKLKNKKWGCIVYVHTVQELTIIVN